MISKLVSWCKAWFEFVEEEQPIELPAKPCDSQVVNQNTKLRYGRTEQNEAGAPNGPSSNG